MKLIMENWNKFQLVTEAQVIHALYENQTITEAEFMDRIKRFAKKKGIPLAVALRLATGAMAPSAAQAADAPADDVPAQVDQAEESQSLGVVSNWGFIGSRIKKIDREQGTNSSTSWKTDYIFFEIPGTGQVTAYPAGSEVPKNLEPANPTAHDLNYSALFGYGDYFK